MQQRILERNIKLYESLRIDERIGNKEKMNEIDAFGIYNIFKIEPVQDLALLSKSLSAQIGMTLATLTDIHHLRSTDINPIYPKLLKEEFPELYNNKELCDQLFKSYKKVFLRIIEEETYLLSPEERGMLQSNRSLQLNEIKTLLAIQDEKKSNEEIEYLIREYCRKAFGVEDPDFKYVWEICLDEMSAKDMSFFESLLPQIKDEAMQRQLKKKLNQLA
jgi:hypothetical protein